MRPSSLNLTIVCESAYGIVHIPVHVKFKALSGMSDEGHKPGLGRANKQARRHIYPIAFVPSGDDCRIAVWCSASILYPYGTRSSFQPRAVGKVRHTQHSKAHGVPIVQFRG